MLALDAAALGLAAAASPGPFQALLVERSVRLGPRRALPLALVPLASDPPVLLACLLALSGLPPALLRALLLLGGLLLCWMGLSALRALPREQAPAAPRSEGFLQAALVNLLNPNVWIFWSVVGGPLLTGALRASPARGLGFLAAFYLPLTFTNAALVLVFGAVGGLGRGVRRGLAALSATAFLVLGLVQLWRAFSGG